MAGTKRRMIDEREQRRRPITLGDLVEDGLDIFCWCNRCCHNAVVAREVLLAQLGPDAPVPEVGARMRCSGCGAKDVATRPAWPTIGPVARHG